MFDLFILNKRSNILVKDLYFVLHCEHINIIHMVCMGSIIIYVSRILYTNYIGTDDSS